MLDTTEQQRKLDAFLVDNHELEALNARLATFNLFQVLRIARAEIRHSNVLAWLLTPGESHGLGDTFLRRFLSRILMENDEIGVKLTPAGVELMPFGDVEVLREWHNIDILVHSRIGKWCMLIENKIHSKESKGQLREYKETVKHEITDVEIIPILLTLEGDDPSEQGKEAGYIAWSHVQVLELADQVIGQNRARIPSDAATFLAHYLDILRRLTMQDEKLVDLCKTIYRKHREAIDLIMEYGGSSQFMDACEVRVKELVECEFVKNTGQMLWFLPMEMARNLPTVKLTKWGFLPRHVGICCWFIYLKKAGKLQAVMEVGPMEDNGLRVRLLKAVKQAGFKFKEKPAFKEGGKFTRIISKIKKLRTNEDGEPDDDPDYIKTVTESLWKELWDEGSKITEVLSGFDWKGHESR